MNNSGHTITFDRDTLKTYREKFNSAVKEKRSSFVFKGNLIKVETAKKMIADFDRAFENEPEAEMVKIPYAENDNILFLF